MLDPQSWLEQAQTLTLGQRRRFDHDCGAGRTLIVDHKEQGYSAYCWRCSDQGFHPHPQPSMAERLARLKAVRVVEAEVEADPRPPMPANFDPSTWPLDARVWLYKAGFSNDRIQGLGFYYVERLDRVVLPVCNDGRVLYWQARAVDYTARAKYLNPRIDKSKLFAKHGSSGPLVLTEDILSAARVGEYATGWALLGTALSDAQARQVQARRVPVTVWLDDDPPGRRAAGKVVAKLRLLGVRATVLHTPNDPKFYSREEITQFLLT